MPYQVTLRLKSGRARAQPAVREGPTPKLGEVINCPADGGTVKARVTNVTRSSLSVPHGRTLDLVTAEEL